MIETEVTIVNKAGMHTRPASMIVRIAAKYKADFFISETDLKLTEKA